MVLRMKRLRLRKLIKEFLSFFLKKKMTERETNNVHNVFKSHLKNIYISYTNGS
jgi:hypothetical protein